MARIKLNNGREIVADRETAERMFPGQWVEVPEQPAPASSPRITRDELARRLGPRRVLIAQAATYGHPRFDPDVAAFVTLLGMQDVVELDAVELDAGLALLEAKQLITADDTARAKAGRSGVGGG